MFSTHDLAAAANNGIVGSIPDVYDDSSPLQYLSMRNNKLTGTVPATLGLAQNLQVLLQADCRLGTACRNGSHMVMGT